MSCGSIFCSGGGSVHAVSNWKILHGRGSLVCDIMPNWNIYTGWYVGVFTMPSWNLFISTRCIIVYFVSRWTIFNSGFFGVSDNMSSRHCNYWFIVFKKLSTRKI